MSRYELENGLETQLRGLSALGCLSKAAGAHLLVVVERGRTPYPIQPGSAESAAGSDPKYPWLPAGERSKTVWPCPSLKLQ